MGLALFPGEGSAGMGLGWGGDNEETALLGL